MSSRGTPNRPKSMALTPKMEQLRSTSPADYPCFKETGFYKPTDGCQQRCCIIPSKTPDGEDTPKWSAMVAARMEDEDPVPQPIFDSQQSPKPSSKRPRTPSSYASSSFSPSEVPERKKRSLAGRELASCMARIQPTTRQVAPVSRRTDV